jgi:hypothetical protein
MQAFPVLPAQVPPPAQAQPPRKLPLAQFIYIRDGFQIVLVMTEEKEKFTAVATLQDWMNRNRNRNPVRGTLATNDGVVHVFFFARDDDAMPGFYQAIIAYRNHLKFGMPVEMAINNQPQQGIDDEVGNFLVELNEQPYDGPSLLE